MQGKEPFEALQRADTVEFGLDSLSGEEELGLEEGHGDGQQRGDQEEGAGHKEVGLEPLLKDLSKEAFDHPHLSGADTGKAELEELADLLHKGARHHPDHQKAA